MFRKLKEFLVGEVSDIDVDKSGKATEFELHVAVAVLLFEMAGMDSSIAHEEAAAICDTMQKEFGIEEKDIPELIEIAVVARKNEGKIDEFINLINSNFNDKQKQKILAMIWKVVEADGTVDKFEERFATQMKFRLQLSDELADAARSLGNDEKESE